MLVVKAHKIDLTGRGERGDGGGGSAGDDERRLDLAVLQGLDAVAEGLIGRVDVLVGVDAVDAEHVNGVEVHARAGGADGDAFALQVGDALDVWVERDDLHLLHIERGDRGEGRVRRVKQARALIGVSADVGLHEAELRVARRHCLDVRLGAAGGDRGHAGRGLVAHLAGEHGAEAVIGALVAAGGEGQLAAAGRRGRGVLLTGRGVRRGRVAVAARDERKDHHRGKDKGYELFHFTISFMK